MPLALPSAGARDRQLDDDSLDLLYLDRQLGSLASVILARTAPAFIAEAQRRMTDLHVAHECEDLARLEHIARTWKGSALSVGARSLAALLESIEKQAAMRHLPVPAQSGSSAARWTGWCARWKVMRTATGPPDEQPRAAAARRHGREG